MYAQQAFGRSSRENPRSNGLYGRPYSRFCRVSRPYLRQCAISVSKPRFKMFQTHLKHVLLEPQCVKEAES